MDTEILESTNLNSTSLNENECINNSIKIKRKRKKKNEKIQKFKYPDCQKGYQDYRSLLCHKKNKHNYYKEKSKKTKTNKKLSKCKNFFSKEKRKCQNDKNKIDLNFIKEKLLNIFKDYNYQLFFDYIDIKNYPFYELIINKWDKENLDLGKECLNEDNNVIKLPNKIKMTNLDDIFIEYLKDTSTKTNINYFSFIIKFVVIFREGINYLKKDLIKKEFKNDKNVYYSQLFNAESIPEFCNDFFNNFLIKYNYFYLDKKNLIEIVFHFCYWLYKRRYTQYFIETFDMKE